MPNALDDGELKILYRWTNERDGGVCATGEHADLGEALCSRIPRLTSQNGLRCSPTPPVSAGAGRKATAVFLSVIAPGSG